MMVSRRVKDEWRDAFVLQARLHEVPGSRIGDALAEIDSHCADSGQRPQDAFGDPVAYADALAATACAPDSAADSADRPRRHSCSTGLRAVGTVGGILCLLTGAGALAEGTRAGVSAGDCVSAVAAGLAVTLVDRAVLRPGRRQLTWWLGVVVTLTVGVMFGAVLLLPDPLLLTSGWTLAGAGLLLFVLAWWPNFSGRILADRIVDPRTGSEARRTPWLVSALIRWFVPVALLCLVVVTVLLSRAS